MESLGCLPLDGYRVARYRLMGGHSVLDDAHQVSDPIQRQAASVGKLTKVRFNNRPTMDRPGLAEPESE